MQKKFTKLLTLAIIITIASFAFNNAAIAAMSANALKFQEQKIKEIKKNKGCIQCDLTFIKQERIEKHFPGKILSYKNFHKSNFSSSQLAGFTLQANDFSGALFQKTNLSKTILAQSNFSNADFSKTIFTGSNLRDTNFRNTLVSAVRFLNCTLTNADFTGARFANYPESRTKPFYGSDVKGMKITDEKFLRYLKHLSETDPKFNIINYDKINK